MAKGFTDSEGRFRPTGNKRRKSSRDKSIDVDIAGEQRMSQMVRDAMVENFGGMQRVLGEKTGDDDSNYKLISINEGGTGDDREFVLVKDGEPVFNSKNFDQVEIMFNEINTKGFDLKNLDIEDPLSESNSKRKIQALTSKMQNTDLELSEREINFIKNTLNRNPRDQWSNGEQVMLDASWAKTDLDDGYMITNEQNEKGKEWLNRNQQRDNMGFRETAVMDDFKEIRLEGFSDIANMGAFLPNYIPVWRVHANDGSTFQYRNIGGEMEISG